MLPTFNFLQKESYQHQRLLVCLPAVCCVGLAANIPGNGKAESKIENRCCRKRTIQGYNRGGKTMNHFLAKDWVRKDEESRGVRPKRLRTVKRLIEGQWCKVSVYESYQAAVARKERKGNRKAVKK